MSVSHKSCMNRKTVVAVCLAAVTTLSAQNPRAERNGPWSPQEIKRIVTDSPWARTSQTSPPILVRWESALPVSEACSQGDMERYLFSCASKLLYLSGLSDKFAGLAKHFYILSMSNYPKPPELTRGTQPPEHSPAANAALASLGKRMQQTTLLRRTEGPAIRPRDIVVLPAGDTLLVLIFFPRTQPLTLNDKEILFESTYGSVRVSARFDLRSMLYKGRVEL
jgi:hypothetical protein